MRKLLSAATPRPSILVQELHARHRPCPRLPPLRPAFLCDSRCPGPGLAPGERRTLSSSSSTKPGRSDAPGFLHFPPPFTTTQRHDHEDHLAPRTDPQPVRPPEPSTPRRRARPVGRRDAPTQLPRTAARTRASGLERTATEPLNPTPAARARRPRRTRC